MVSIRVDSSAGSSLGSCSSVAEAPLDGSLDPDPDGVVVEDRLSGDEER